MSATSGISNFITGGASSLSQISGALGGADFMMEMQGVQKEMQQNQWRKPSWTRKTSASMASPTAPRRRARRPPSEDSVLSVAGREEIA